MTTGRRQYNEADMMQMQREAEARVRDMQAKARRVALDPPEEDPARYNRNWSTNPGMLRQRSRRQQQNGRPAQEQVRERPSEPERKPPAPADEAAAPPPVPPAPPKTGGTIVGDIMDALGLDEDYLLIIGLILILINQRADTTLILALAYLLI